MTAKESSKVQFHFLTSSFTLKDRNNLKTYLIKVFRQNGRQLDTLNYIFCTDEYLLSINQQFLKHDYFTDIITFDLSESDSKKTIGEIYISIDRVRENALNLKTSLKEELHRVIFHGVLHLCGYKDKTQKDVIEMRNQEQRLLDLYFKK